ncbi:MAG: pyridoxal phosphate-dependent aminotransferase [Bacteroidales bacterium]|nr:pyridoxal phosphate-dependent aminotransferase [Bacteroidales bacterium]
MNNNTPIDSKVVTEVIDSMGLPDFSKATIREVVAIANKVEALTGKKYVRMEMGVPGLKPDAIGTEAEIAALRNGVAAKYPMLDGHPDLKQQASRFVKAFIDVDIPARCCIPTSGSMQGAFASFMTIYHANPERDTVLFIDPGFPVQKTQLDIIGLKHESFDMFNYRGNDLIAKVESYLASGKISAIIYSNPNNPSWMCLTDDELRGIAELADKYDIIVVEDLAYFGMDFRRDISHPYEAPFQPSVAKYTDNCLLMISGSKAFSYAGQRIGVVAISEKLFDRSYEALGQRYRGLSKFGNIFVNRILYCLSSGTAHSAQFALAAMFKAACDGQYNFLEGVHEYERRANAIKKMFIDNGFRLVYADDLGQPVADGFYFTVTYPGMTGGELMHELLYYGISIISLDTTGSLQQGLRVCVSFVDESQFPTLAERLKAFGNDHKK